VALSIIVLNLALGVHFRSTRQGRSTVQKSWSKHQPPLIKRDCSSHRASSEHEILTTGTWRIRPHGYGLECSRGSTSLARHLHSSGLEWTKLRGKVTRAAFLHSFSRFLFSVTICLGVELILVWYPILLCNISLMQWGISDGECDCEAQIIDQSCRNDLMARSGC
jgi:hypothetical protein